MVVVSDNTTITNLIHINRLELLRQLFGKVMIPEEVYRELAELPNQKAILNETHWIEVVAISNSDKLKKFLESLDKGEAEAITLAIEKQADVLIIDELQGRKVAKQHNLRIIGLLGILIDAKYRGLLEQIKPLLDQLINDHGFWIKPELYREVLKTVEE